MGLQESFPKKQTQSSCQPPPFSLELQGSSRVPEDTGHMLVYNRILEIMVKTKEL